MKGHDGYCRADCDEIIACRAGAVRDGAALILKKNTRVYCAGASGIGAGRAAGAEPELAWERDCAAFGAVLCDDVPASAAPVVSCGRVAGSAAMILTGGIEDAEGKYKPFGDFGAVAGAGAAGGRLLATGRASAAGQPAA
jgi:hypothetical protein